MLSPETLASLLPQKTLGQSLFVFEELPSTNTYALKLGKNTMPQGTVILADSQTVGRGRLQRSWFSPPGANIYGSVIFSFTRPFQTMGWIPLMAGTALAEAIGDHTNLQLTLKWPNDILITERKVGGILCESFKRNSAETCVVIGFGINVNLSQATFPKDLQPIATSLQIQAQRPLDRHQLLSRMIVALEQGWEALLADGPPSCRLAYTARCSTLGSQIQAQFPDGREVKGVAQSIGEQGQLQIQTATSDLTEQSAKIVDIHSGDIRHIRKASTSQ